MSSGIYHTLLADNFITKSEDLEPDVSKYEFYTESFWELSTCRDIGMGEGPIPFTAIKEYFTAFPYDNFYEFLLVIRSMDDSYLRAREDERDKKKVRGKNDSGKKK